MSVAFKNVRTKMGLDDVLNFGKYQGLTVLFLIHSRNGYIDWLITQGKQFYPSVHEELKRHPFVKSGRKMYHYDMQPDYDYDELGDWFDDVPF